MYEDSGIAPRLFVEGSSQGSSSRLASEVPSGLLGITNACDLLFAAQNSTQNDLICVLRQHGLYSPDTTQGRPQTTCFLSDLSAHASQYPLIFQSTQRFLLLPSPF